MTTYTENNRLTTIKNAAYTLVNKFAEGHNHPFKVDNTPELKRFYADWDFNYRPKSTWLQIVDGIQQPSADKPSPKLPANTIMRVVPITERKIARLTVSAQQPRLLKRQESQTTASVATATITLDGETYDLSLCSPGDLQFDRLIIESDCGLVLPQYLKDALTLYLSGKGPKKQLPLDAFPFTAQMFKVNIGLLAVPNQTISSYKIDTHWDAQTRIKKNQAVFHYAQGGLITCSISTNTRYHIAVNPNNKTLMFATLPAIEGLYPEIIASTPARPRRKGQPKVKTEPTPKVAPIDTLPPEAIDSLPRFKDIDLTTLFDHAGPTTQNCIHITYFEVDFTGKTNQLTTRWEFPHEVHLDSTVLVTEANTPITRTYTVIGITEYAPATVATGASAVAYTVHTPENFDTMMAGDLRSWCKDVGIPYLGKQAAIKALKELQHELKL